MSTGEENKLHVFLCHASEDKVDVRDLYQNLSAVNWIDPWLDEEKLLPGQEWEMMIEDAVEETDVVIVFLSSLSLTKEGYVQSELRTILEIAREKPVGTIFVIPLRLDDCKLPRQFKRLHYVDYFPEVHRTFAFQKLLRALHTRLDEKTETEKQREVVIQARIEKEAGLVQSE